MSAIVAFIVAHQAIVAAAAVGIADLILAAIPSLQANGILHALYLFLKGKASPPAIPSA